MGDVRNYMLCRKLERFRTVPYNAARRGPIHPPSGRASLFSALKGRKTLNLNHVFKVISVDLVPFYMGCRVWLGLSAGAHSTGIVGGGQSARACPGLAIGYTQNRWRRIFPPPRRRHYSLQEESGRGNVWKVLRSRIRPSNARDA
jgi:hypothetical protein